MTITIFLYTILLSCLSGRYLSPHFGLGYVNQTMPKWVLALSTIVSTLIGVAVAMLILRQRIEL